MESGGIRLRINIMSVYKSITVSMTQIPKNLMNTKGNLLNGRMNANITKSDHHSDSFRCRQGYDATLVICLHSKCFGAFTSAPYQNDHSEMNVTEHLKYGILHNPCGLIRTIDRNASDH